MQTVFVGLSGGVDSSVVAARLKARGFNVVGVFIKVWHPDWLVCNWEQERLDAMRVAARLDIPFLTCDAEVAYRDEVAKYFIAEYSAGRTPNPDVLCNKAVKFGHFLKWAKEKGADYVATGHYAQNIKTERGFELHRGIDTNKDQSYFLWTLTQPQLQHILFPVGDTEKPSIRNEAAAAGLITSEKKDSQGICFLGHIDIPEFLSHYVALTPGAVLNEAGERIGEHSGALVYTIGQRHGFTITTTNTHERPHFVSKKDIEHNTITVSADRPTTTDNTKITVTDTNWITGEDIAAGLTVQFRYRQMPIPVTITKNDTDDYVITPSTTTDLPAVGQSCVFYRDSQCVGGGIIAG